MKAKILELVQKELRPGIKGRFFHTKNNTIGFIELEAGAVLPEHNHIHEQTTQVIEGQLELIVDGQSQILKPGMIITIPSNVLHQAKALTLCRVTDIFSPIREDYK
jgi:quercetin dioxygenase-like cupin family protein